MATQSLPETIATIITQAGGFGLRGAFAYIGAHQLRYQCVRATGEVRSSQPSRLNEESRQVEFEVGISMRVNGKPGRGWLLIVAYEPDDLYTVWLVEGHKDRKPGTMVLARHGEVYYDTLQSVIESTYDQAIQEHNGGFIPLG